jgi:hypothetical protein
MVVARYQSWEEMENCDSNKPCRRGRQEWGGRLILIGDLFTFFLQRILYPFITRARIVPDGAVTAKVACEPAQCRP